MISIKLSGKTDLKDYTLIEGFPGVGLVGPMAISYIVDKLKMDYIGYVESESFPPLVSVHGSTPMPPIRIYASKENKLVAIFAEFAVTMELVYPLSDAIYNFAKENGLSSIYSIGGMPLPQQGPDANAPFAIASTPAALKEAKDAGLKPVEEGVSTGVSAMLLLKSANEKGKDINIMVPVQQNIIDPSTAVIAIQSLNKLMKLNIDITELDKEAKMVQAKIKEIINKHRETHEGYKKTVDSTGPSMYA